MTRNGQSGAFFGLDARLAIAIFALLSILAGYVAYGRIQIAKQTALISDFESIDEALKGYQTDMGTFLLFTLARDVNETGADDLEVLWDKDKVKEGFRARWNGPYLHRETRQHRDFGRFSTIYAQGDRQNYCTTDSDCYVWITLSNVPAKVWKDLNRVVDEGGGAYHEQNGEDIISGRVQADADTDPRILFYRSVARPATGN